MTEYAEEVFDPRDGSALDVDAVNMTTLVEVAMDCRRRELLLYQWRKACEAELYRRLRAGDHKLAIVKHADGRETEVAVQDGKSRVWDGQELRSVVHDLIDEGILMPSQVVGLTTNEVKVDGNVARRLLKFVSGEPFERLSDCYVLTSRSRPTVRLADVPQIVASAEDAA